MTDQNIIETARKAYQRHKPRAFLSFIRQYKRPYDSEKVRRELDALEQAARARLEESNERA